MSRTSRTLFWLTLLLLVSGLASCGKWYRFAVPDALVIAAPDQPLNYPPAPFNHRAHVRRNRDASGNLIACIVCHHTSEPEPKAPPPLCSECHKVLEEPGTPSYIHAFHLGCVDCHREVEATGRAAGPVTECNDCHPPR